MAYVDVLGTTDALLAKLKSARAQILCIYRAVRQVKILEQKADLEIGGYDPWPIDDDANALQMAACAALYNNILTALKDGTLENWRYGYLIKAGRPPLLTTFDVSDFAPGTYIIGNDGDGFSKVYGHPTEGDKVKLRWTNSEGVIREVIGLIVTAATANTIRTTLYANPECLANNNFTTNPDTKWLWNPGSGVSHDTVNFKADFNAASVGLSQATANFASQPASGGVYRFSYDITDYSVGSIKPYISLSNGTTLYGEIRDANGSYTDDFIVPVSVTVVTIGFGIHVNATLKVDNTTFREILVSDETIEVELEAVYV